MTGSINIPQTPSTPQRPFRLAALAGIVLLSAGVGAGAGAGVATLVDNGHTTSPSAAVSTVTTPSGVNVSTGSTVADLYAGLRPSVVKITVASSSGDGTGSGVILDADGHIVTNYHVVQGA